MPLHHDIHVGDTSTFEDTGFRTDLCQFVLIVRKVHANRVIYLANLVAPCQIQVNTLIFHVADIYFRLVCVTSQSRPVRIDQHIGGLLQVPVEVDA